MTDRNEKGHGHTDISNPGLAGELKGRVPGPIEIIINEVAAEFGITAKALLSRNRSNRFSHPRILAMALARELTKASFPAIGRAFGRDHSSVVSAVARSPELQKRYPDYAVKYEIVKHRLLSPQP